MKRSPAAAVFLSLLPGLGHIYVGQVGKGFLIGLLFVSTIHMADRGSGVIGVFIPFIVLYAMVDAHRSAVEVNRIVASGATVPRTADYGLGRWWGYILIGLGVLFTLENFDLIDFEWIWNLWPLGLIAVGVYLLRRRSEPPIPTESHPPAPYPETPTEGIDRIEPDELARDEHGNV